MGQDRDGRPGFTSGESKPTFRALAPPGLVEQPFGLAGVVLERRVGVVPVRQVRRDGRGGGLAGAREDRADHRLAVDAEVDRQPHLGVQGERQFGGNTQPAAIGRRVPHHPVAIPGAVGLGQLRRQHGTVELAAAIRLARALSSSTKTTVTVLIAGAPPQ